MKKNIINKINNLNFDVLIIGAGPSGCVLSERFANKLNMKCLILEKRNHIAGNCYDYKNSKGILVHKYGPHYLRFKKKKIFKYLSKFTNWIDGNYHVKTFVKKQYLPFPINLTTLEKYFNIKFKNKKEAINFISKKKIKIKKPKNSEELILSQLGKEIYEDFYKNYTIKQWNTNPKNLDKAVVGRIPIRYNRNSKYVNEKIQMMPKKGYTKMFKKMIKNKNIKIILNCDFHKISKKIKKPKILIYSGTPDSYFGFMHGKLQWRSLKFHFKTYKRNFLQSCVQYNFPNNYSFTRKVEIKHVTKQKSKYTTISKEYPSSNGDPYYPINTSRNRKIFNKYNDLIKKQEAKNIFFIGRLANYKYLNTDEVIENALSLFNYIMKKK